MYRLTFQNRQSTRGPFLAREPVVVIGRDATCALRLTDAGISDQHARIEQRADGFYICDLGTANGVRVNGQPVRDQRLAGGDEIELGVVRFVFEIVHERTAGQRAFDPLQFTAVVLVGALVIAQLVLFGWIFRQPHPRRGPTDIVKSAKPREISEPSEVPVAESLLPLPPTDAPLLQPQTSEVLNRMLRITRVERIDAVDTVTLRLQVKAQVGERQIDAGQIAISVQFFTTPATPRNPVWVPVPTDWENFSSHTMSARFFGAPTQCAGYVVRTYYRKQLQDVLAVPPALAQSP